MVKKFFLLILIVCAIVGGFYYSAKNNKNDTRKEISLWTIQLKPVAQGVIEKSISQFEEKHSNYKVVWVDIPIAEAQKRILAATLGANPPDLVNLNPEFSLVLAQVGALENFSQEDLTEFSKPMVEMLKFKNGVFAIPFYATSSVSLYNKELFKSANIENPPKTYDELFEIAPQIKQKTGVYPFAINLVENESFAKILNKFDVNYQNFSEKEQKIYEILAKFNQLYKNNLISKDSLSINHREMVEKYMSKNAAFVVVGTNFLNMVEQNAPDVYKNSDVGFQLASNLGKYDVALMNFVIPKKAKNKELAKELAKIITSSEAQLELSKSTGVLPANVLALEDEYFKNCDENLTAKARCISIEQLNSTVDKNFGTQNKKEINDTINSTVENVLLNSKNQAEVKNEAKLLVKKLKTLIIR